MGDAVNLEAMRLAQKAHEKAQDADTKAQAAVHANQMHEAVCAERYKNMDSNISDVKLMQQTLQNSITALNTKKDENVGIYKAFTILVMGAGALGGIAKLIGIV